MALYQDRAGAIPFSRLDPRKAFQNETYEKVKELLEGGELVSFIVADTGLDEEEVQRVNLADNFEDFLLEA